MAPLYSLSLSARATMNLHSLNNEGSEGNQTQTRMVNIVYHREPDEVVPANVNAISGDMFKHIQAEHFQRIALTRDLPLSRGAQEMNANRINHDISLGGKDGTKWTTGADGKELSDSELLDKIIRTCALTDVEGILVTSGGKSLPRKSVIEFGWVVGLPDYTTTDSYFHVKYANDRTSTRDRKQRSEMTQAERDTADSERESNVGQAIFHRPASSGIYAVVAHVDLARIGFNDITQRYAIDEAERTRRARALLESLLYTFLQPNGAMRSTQAPHLSAFSGVLTTSSGIVPAPTVSPLNLNYREELGSVCDNLKPIAGESVQMQVFESLGDFTQTLGAIAQDIVPASLPVAQH